jgi:GTPase-activating protein SST2
MAALSTSTIPHSLSSLPSDKQPTLPLSPPASPAQATTPRTRTLDDDLAPDDADAATVSSPAVVAHQHQHPHHQHHQSQQLQHHSQAQTIRHVSNASTTSLPRFSQRSSSGIFSLAAAALDRTQSAFYNISDPVIRPRQSNPGLARLSFAAGSPTSAEPASPIKKQLFRTPSAQSLASNPSAADGKLTSVALPAKAPLSSPYSETDPTLPPPIKFAGRDNKMHQTSSRLLRMTDDERPFTKVRKANSTMLR